MVRAGVLQVAPTFWIARLLNGYVRRSGREVDEEEERADYYLRELRHGSFRRSMLLAEGVEEEKVHARYQDGILEVTLESAAAAREPRRVQIEVPGSQQ